MVVVALVGILSAIGIASFRRQAAASKASEAASVIQAIRAAEEAYRGENQLYLDVSSSNDDWYPSKDFGPTVRSWELKPGGHPDLTKWQTLGARVTQPVLFGYLVNAGRAGATPPTLQLSDSPTLGTPTDAWYVIQARADYDGDGVFCNAAATSWTSEVYIENEGE
jgi:type II secretory pathway pseudopilin PulG